MQLSGLSLKCKFFAIIAVGKKVVSMLLYNKMLSFCKRDKGKNLSLPLFSFDTRW